MKRILYLFFVGCLALSLSYCSGDDGDIGPQGPRGEQGVQGEKGDKGTKGDPGKDGKKGDKGDKGDKGNKGDSGKDGKTGPEGPQGEKGEDGNADVRVFIFNGFDFTNTSKTIKREIDIPFEDVQKGSFSVYLYLAQPHPRLYSIPGYGKGGDTEYAIELGPAPNNGTALRIKNRIGTAGSGEKYDAIYFTYIPATKVEDKRTSTVKNQEFINLEQFLDHYNITESDVIDLR